MEVFNTYTLFEWDSIKSSDGKILAKENLQKANDSFINYQNEINNKASKIIGSLCNRSIDVLNGRLTNRGNNVGIIQTNDGLRFEFKPKFDNYIKRERSFWAFLPRMLNTLCDFKDFNEKLFIDPNSKILLPVGLNYVPLLALSYISLCDKVLRVGLLKKYVKKTEVLRVIKGKIDFPNLAKKKPWEKTRIACTYFDLTFDNVENQIILWCANRLIKSLKTLATVTGGNYISRKLREQYITLTEEITLKPINKSDLNETSYRSIAPHYIELMNICQAILRESLFSLDETQSKSNTGVNFLIDMDWVFEQYMTYLFETVIKENDKYYNLRIESQKLEHLCDNNKINIKPDLLILRNRIPVAVIDFKWKLHEKDKNADFYQIICYSLAELEINKKGSIDANIFSVSNEESGRKHIDTISKVFSDKQSKVVIGKIPLNTILFEHNDTLIIESRIKETIMNYLDTLI
jgi:5-methylcytosine-specific restriction enzyme subunit McrC